MGGVQGQRWILYLTLFQVMVGFGVVIPILPYFAQELGATSLHMGLVVTVWAGAQFLFSPLWGAWSDRVGRRPILLVGLTGYVLTFGVTTVANSIWLVMLARFLGGVLSAATIPTAQAYVADTSEGDARTTQMAGMGAAMNLGFMAGPALGGLLASLGLGYRGTFAAAGALGLLNLILAFFTLPEPPHRHARAAQKSISGIQALGIALAGSEALLFLLAFASTFGGSSMFSMLGYFLKDRLQAGPGLLSVALTVEGVSASLFQGLLVGIVSRRFGEERSISWALVFGGLGFIALATARNAYQLLGAVVLIAAGISFVRPLVTALLSQRTAMEQGMAMGIQTSFDALGRSLGPLWAGVIFLWRDWAPFASAAMVYFLFFALTRWAWHLGSSPPHRHVVEEHEPPAG